MTFVSIKGLPLSLRHKSVRRVPRGQNQRHTCPLAGATADVEANAHGFGTFTDAEDAKVSILVFSGDDSLPLVTHLHGDAFLSSMPYPNLGRLHTGMLCDIQ
jgi:hypothetical protein